MAGVRAAAPMPHSPRARMRTSAVGANAARIDAPQKRAAPIMAMRRRPNRSASEPNVMRSPDSRKPYRSTIHSC